MKSQSKNIPSGFAIFKLQSVTIEVFAMRNILTKEKGEAINHWHIMFLGRNQNVALARMIIFSLIREHVGTPYATIARMYGTSASRVYKYCALIAHYEQSGTCQSTVALKNKIKTQWQTN